MSNSLELDIVMVTISNLMSNKNLKIASDAFIHSDQGVHVRQEVA
ncbi:hypothetical protein [Clostridium felsineum]|nr:hypothetical protein [Clostridium felsineum]